MSAVLRERDWPAELRVVSNREFAALVGCSHKTISNLRLQGMPDPAESPGLAIRWYVTHVASKRAGREPKLTPQGNISGYGAASAKRQYIGEGTLISWKAISEYFGVSPQTVMRWRRREGLPVSNLPDGRVVITLSLIDQWLMARHEQQQQEKLVSIQR